MLGFTKENVALHSIRSGGAIAMFISGNSTIVIQRIGRDSDAFMECVRKQVESFTIGVSSKVKDSIISSKYQWGWMITNMIILSNQIQGMGNLF